MNTAILLVAIVASVSAVPLAPKVVRTPAHDSAIIQSHRLGGNFAYSVHEAHAYGVETPIVKERVVEKGFTLHEGEPVVSTRTSYVKKQIPQYGIVKKQHHIPVVHYSAPIHTVHQVKTVKTVAASPVSYAVSPFQYAGGAVQHWTGHLPAHHVHPI